MAEPFVTLEICAHGVRKLRLDHAPGERDSGLELYTRLASGLRDLDRLVRGAGIPDADAELRAKVRVKTAQSLALFDSMGRSGAGV